ncbi:MAG: FAD:protein FMN transferase [Lentisphaeraceae bacterium]|nr:FAD:protein FMN transferase [Lentisphaeraceae bacterium]
MTQSKNSISMCRPHLGSYVEVDISGAASDDTLVDWSLSIFAEILRIEKMMSFHDPQSELSHINKNASQTPCSISPEMNEILQLALSLSNTTTGMYDISIAAELVKNGALPDHNFEVSSSANWQDIELTDDSIFFHQPLLIDLGGIAKGYAVDRAFKILGELPEDTEVTINAGGDLRMNSWNGKQIGVRVPQDRFGSLTIKEIPMQNTAMASSSWYFNEGDHTILSPDNKKPIKDKRSVSVFANSCMLADALTKVVFLAPNFLEVLTSFNATAVVFEDGQQINFPRQAIWLK